LRKKYFSFTNWVKMLQYKMKFFMFYYVNVFKSRFYKLLDVFLCFVACLK